MKKMEALGIGRPSTYAPTITTIQNRGYILRESRDGTERQLDQIDLKGQDIKVKKISRDIRCGKEEIVSLGYRNGRDGFPFQLFHEYHGL